MGTEKRQRKKEGRQARRQAVRAAARRQQRKRRAVGVVVATAAVLAVLALIAAVGGDDDDETAADTTATTEPVTTTTLDITKPTVTVPDGPPPTELQVTDLEVGEGEEASLGDTIEVHYVGVRYADGEQFDSSWDRGSPVTFDLVEGGLIEGWTEGIPGMRVGGRRQLVIPGSMAYGDEDTGDGRPHGALVFVVDLVAIE